MAYVFLNDGGPEAEEYDNNYFYFDESNSQTLTIIEELLTSHNPKDPTVRARLYDICQSSLNHRSARTYKNVGISWINSFLRSINQLFNIF